MNYPPLSRAAMRPTPCPAPAGHYSHKAQPHSLGVLAELAHDPDAEPHVRYFHRQALEGSLQSLAALVATVSK